MVISLPVSADTDHLGGLYAGIKSCRHHEIEIGSGKNGQGAVWEIVQFTEAFQAIGYLTMPEPIPLGGVEFCE